MAIYILNAFFYNIKRYKTSRRSDQSYRMIILLLLLSDVFIHLNYQQILIAEQSIRQKTLAGVRAEIQ